LLFSHNAYTGYFIIETFFRFILNRELNGYYILDDSLKIKQKTNVQLKRTYSIHQEKLNKFSRDLLEVENSVFKLQKSNLGYDLITFGFFQDEDLNILIETQSSIDQKIAIALFGLDHQLDILDADALRLN
jgi:hypothetical protein